MTSSWRFWGRAAALAGLALAAAWAQAQPAYPSGPVTLVVPFAAGSGTDAVARLVASRLSEVFKQPVVVDNRAGASGQIAAQYVAKARPDGYTLFMTTNTTHSANPWLIKALKYDPIEDFTPVIRVGELPFALAVHPSLPVHSVAELVAYARAHPDKLSYATPNSTSLVASETFKHATQTRIVGVPYKSSPQALTDLIGNVVQMYVVDLGSGWSMLKTDRVRTLGVTTARGTGLLPQAEPIGKTVAGFDITSWNGVFGPAKMPQQVTERLHTVLHTILQDTAVQEQLAQLGFEVRSSDSPAQFAAYVQAQLQTWGRLIEQAGIEAL